MDLDDSEDLEDFEAKYDAEELKKEYKVSELYKLCIEEGLNVAKKQKESFYIDKLMAIPK